MPSYPSTFSAWRRSGKQGSKEDRLSIYRTDNETLPSNLSPYDVIVKIHTISLNYREIAMLIGTYPMELDDRGIPCSDAAAEVVAVGSAVSRFVVGDRVSPHTVLWNLDMEEADDENAGMTGSNCAGVLREYGVYHEEYLVKAPDHLSWEEVCTLPCAGVTAWNALNGLKDVPKGSYALLQGTGGVSMFSLVLCLSAGIRPIITSSSDEKIAAIKKLSPEISGLNYKSVSDQDAEVKRLTNGRGVHFVVNNTGPRSLMQDIGFLSHRSGTVSMVGFLEGFDADWAPGEIMKLMHKAAQVKGIAMGTRSDFEEMNRYLEQNKVHFDMLLPDKPFTFDTAPDAYDHLESGKFHGKVIIKME